MMTTLPLQLSQASGVPFYRQIVDQVAALIHGGQLAPGERLPSVRELAQALLVSLITVRRAYAELEAAGLIQLRQGQGSFVAEHVQAASRKRALAEAQEALTEGVLRAVQLGMPPDDVRQAVDEILEDESVVGGAS
ncbi:MAG: GntR family transcriptional regulator [Alphaproteobacteria bacterium]|nr:GntR family transcriptional regulator [Alphaproteobacteria bacterium]